MKMKLFMLGMLFFTANIAFAANVAPPKVIGATTVDTMFAKKLLDRKTTFVDVRSAEDYAKGHIPGAVNLPLKDGFTSDALSAVVKKNKSVVFYCNGIKCQASSKATQQALDWGWTSVFYYRVGFPEWKRVGLAVE
jgi:rhodanese-related sulfurtransferase